MTANRGGRPSSPTQPRVTARLPSVLRRSTDSGARGRRSRRRGCGRRLRRHPTNARLRGCALAESAILAPAQAARFRGAARRVQPGGEAAMTAALGATASACASDGSDRLRPAHETRRDHAGLDRRGETPEAGAPAALRVRPAASTTDGFPARGRAAPRRETSCRPGVPAAPRREPPSRPGHHAARRDRRRVPGIARDRTTWHRGLAIARRHRTSAVHAGSRGRFSLRRRPALRPAAIGARSIAG